MTGVLLLAGGCYWLVGVIGWWATIGWWVLLVGVLNILVGITYRKRGREEEAEDEQSEAKKTKTNELVSCSLANIYSNSITVHHDLHVIIM